MAQVTDIPASTRALHTVEILEEILLQLEFKPLLLIPSRVCRFWRDVVETSPSIQQALFFRPVPNKLQQISSNEDPFLSRMSVKPRLNPFLNEKFSPVFSDRYEGQNHNMYRQASSFYALPWTKNPLKEHKHVSPQWPTVHSVEVRSDCDTAARQDDQEARQRFTCKGASWRRMLVSQPPPPHIGVLFPDFTDHHIPKEMRPYKYFRKASTRSDDASGVRMGQLFDLMQYHAGHHKLNLLWQRVHWFSPDGPLGEGELNHKMCLELFRKTFLVVELADYEDQYYDRDPYSPANVSDFDNDFRCKDFSMPQLKTEETVWTGSTGDSWFPPWSSFIWPKFRPLPEQRQQFKTMSLDVAPRDGNLEWE